MRTGLQDENILEYLKITLAKVRDPLIKRTFNVLIIHMYLVFSGADILKYETFKSATVKFFLVLIRSVFRPFDLFNPKKADILIYVTERNQINEIVPVAEALQSKGKQVCFLTYKTDIHNLITGLGFRSYRFHLPVVLFRKRSKRNLLKDIDGSVDQRMDIIEETYYYWEKYIRKLESCFSAILSRIKPLRVIVGYDIPKEGRLFAILCKEFSIPTFMIQHGGVTIVDPIFSLHEVDEVFTFGSLSKEVLDSCKCKASVVVTGSPYFENTVKKKVENIMKSPMGEVSWILIAFSGPGHFTSKEHHLLCVDAIDKLALTFPEIQFLIKLHKKDRKEYYGNMRATNVGFSLPTHASNIDVLDWIGHCQLVITGASTVAIEAMLLKRPVISLDLLNEYEQFDFIKRGAIHRVTSTEMLFNLINQWLVEGATVFQASLRASEEFLKDFYADEESPTNHIVDCITIK